VLVQHEKVVAVANLCDWLTSPA